MKNKISKGHIFFLILVIIIGLFGYFFYRLEQQRQSLEIELLQAKIDLASTTQDFKAVIYSLEQSLATTTAQRDDFEQKYIIEKSRLDLLDMQVQGIKGVVSMLEKLQKTDKELLKKYSKVYFLNDNYIPETLVKIDAEYTYNPENDYLFCLGAWSFLQDLMRAAEGDGVDIRIISAYRSFGEQGGVKETYKIIYGSGANTFSADQGYSEHQLGTAVDFTTSEVGATFSGFENTPAYLWLLDNAYKYGFILSYPKDNQYYQFEPWHWRFVSRDLAEFLRYQGKNFYDLDQRVIDEYLVFIFN